MIEDLREKRKVLGNLKINLFYTGFIACIVLAIFVVIYSKCVSDSIVIPLGFGVVLPSMVILFLYFMYLDYLYDMKRRLDIEEKNITCEVVRETLNKTLKNVIEKNTEALGSEERSLAILKEKVYKTSNPFLIKKYLNKKIDFEWYSFQTEIYTEYVNRDIIESLKELRDSEEEKQ